MLQWRTNDLTTFENVWSLVTLFSDIVKLIHCAAGRRAQYLVSRSAKLELNNQSEQG